MLRHKAEMVTYEAANAIVTLRSSARDLPPAISVLQLFLSSPKPTLRSGGRGTLRGLGYSVLSPKVKLRFGKEGGWEMKIDRVG